MEFAIVDPVKDESAALASLLQEVYPAARIFTFEDPLCLIQHCLLHQIDAVFTEIVMPSYPLDGLMLISMIKERFPRVKTCIVTKSGQYRPPAAALRVDGYLLKLPQLSELRRVLETEAVCLDGIDSGGAVLNAAT